MAAIKYWLWLSSQTRLSPRARAALAAYYGGAEEAFHAPAGDFCRVPGVNSLEAQLLEKRDMSRVEPILAACQMQRIDIITMQDADYPARLKNIFAPPVVLYVKGSLKGLDEEAAVAVIGTRKASPYGLKMGRNLAWEIAKAGGTVISLITEGIDEAAAKGALLGGGRCIAVLGTGHRERERALCRDIARSGALVSEYAPGTPSLKSFFRDRNRIASGLSVGVTVVEAPENSGALLFAAEALEQGREIFAVPGNADAPNSAGTIELIKQGAKPVTCGWDVLEEFAPLYPEKLRGKNPEKTPEQRPAEQEKSSDRESKMPREPKKEIDKEKGKGYIDLREQLSGLSAEQLEIVKAVSGGSQHIDDIIEATGYTAAKVLSQLTLLEIKGYIRRDAGKRISLNLIRK